MRKLRAVAMFGALSITLACGGGSGGSGGGTGGGGGAIPGCTTGTGASASGNAIAASAANVAAITVDGGLPNNPYVNGVFTSVTVCVPGSTTCQTIDHVLVDTGSYGLRLLSSSGGGALTLVLPLEADSNVNGNAIGECAQFSDGITWGPLRMADIYIGGPTVGSGESAKTVPGSGVPGMPVQIIGDPGFKTVPSACSSFGTPEDTLQTLLANGIIGIGPFAQDCGGACTIPAASGNPGLYYSCPSTGCASMSQPVAEPVAAQVWNPVAAFTPLTAGSMADNNGDILELPGVTASGLAVVNGSLVFGIGTQNNNGLGSAKVYTGDSSANITTVFANQTLTNSSFIDSGSNGYFFNFPSGTTVATCSGSSGFYCPVSGSQPISLACSATNSGNNIQSGTVNFNIANLDTLPGSSAAFNNIGGPNTPPQGSSGPTGFDWGLPFFFGRNVYTGMLPTSGTSTPAGVPPGPFYAY